MALFQAIAAARTAADVLWTAELGIDHLGNDWATISIPFDWTFPQFDLPSATSPTPTTAETLSLNMPADWALDDEWDILQLSLGIIVQGQTTGDLGEIWLDHSGTLSNVVTISNGAPFVDQGLMTISWLAGSEPVGQFDVLLKIKALTHTTTTISVKRDLASPTKLNNFIRVE